MSPAIDGEKRANCNWLGRPANEIRLRLFEQEIFRVDFLVAENVEKFLDRSILRMGPASCYSMFLELASSNT